MATIGGIDPNFAGGQAPVGGEPPYAVLPGPAAMFSRRAARFAALAPGHDIGDYLLFLGTLAAAQADVAASLAPPALPDTSVALANAMPPLTRDLAAEPGALDVLGRLIAALERADLAEGPAAAVAALAAADADEHRRLCTAVADGYFELERLAECALVAAALQVWYAAHAAQLDAGSLRNVGEGVCPCCGGAPVSSTLTEMPQAATGLRYLTCSLCLTQWNHIRVKCTACGAEKGISYRQVEGATGEIAAEVCEACRGYAKHLLQTKNPQLDPIADDVASYGLDMMLREDGWRRTGLNPFLILP